MYWLVQEEPKNLDNIILVLSLSFWFEQYRFWYSNLLTVASELISSDFIIPTKVNKTDKYWSISSKKDSSSLGSKGRIKHTYGEKI